jgi:hypothetical protein
MSDLNFKINSNDFANVLDEFKTQLQRELNQSVRQLAKITYEKTLEIAGQKLKNTLDFYKDNLSMKNDGPSITVITLDEKAVGLEDGTERFDMKPGLLAGKSGKDGKNGRYAIVPFKHNSKPSQQTQKAQDLTNQIKKVLRQENIPYAKIEKDSNGSPKIGLLHKIDIDSDKPTPKASHPALHGLRIYQNEVKDANGNNVKDKQGNNKIERGILTFRTVKEGQDKWMHPGFRKIGAMDEAFQFAMEQWDSQILPELMKKWGGK